MDLLRQRRGLWLDVEQVADPVDLALMTVALFDKPGQVVIILWPARDLLHHLAAVKAVVAARGEEVHLPDGVCVVSPVAEKRRDRVMDGFDLWAVVRES